MSSAMNIQPLHPQPAESTEPRKGKNIVICCDGTGNLFSAPTPESPKDSKNGRNSNVVKLYTTLEVSNQQVAYYHPGVGTMGAPTATHWMTKEWSQIKGLAFGAGFRDNVLDAYRYLMEVYNDNGGDGNEDQVFLFGFSRGSYTVRALAGLLHGYGLLCRGNEGHLPYAWRMYVDQHSDRTKHHVDQNDTFLRTFSHPTFRIHFVGVFDTVSSVGWLYSPLKLFSVASNPSVAYARHAVSIDEHRCFFMDNLYDDRSTDTDTVQVWFAGVHSDVGGSYAQPESGLAYESLRWMLAEAKALGLRTETYREGLVFGMGPSADSLLYETPTSWKLHRSLDWAWWIPEIVPHVYYNQEFGQEYMRVPLGLRRRHLPPGALVHQSVWDRMTAPPPGAQPYHPRNCPKDALDRTPPQPGARDGTAYRVFTPVPKPKRHPLVMVLDRFVVPVLFIVVEVLLLVPAMLFGLGLLLKGTAIVLVDGGPVVCQWAAWFWHEVVRLFGLSLTWVRSR